VKRREFVAGLTTVLAWSSAGRAQQSKMPTVGLLSGGRESTDAAVAEAFRTGLRELGFVEGRNVDIIYRWAETRYDQLPRMAEDLVGRRVAAIFASAPIAAALGAKSATDTVPIVFSTGFDPVTYGLVASLNRPGGNVTGVTFLVDALVAKRLEVLHEVIPTARSVGFLVTPTSSTVQAQIREAEAAARIIGLRLVVVNASTAGEIDEAFATLVRARVDALLAGADNFFYVQAGQLVALAARHALPAIYTTSNAVKAGGLVSYGANFFDANRLAGTYVGRILKGEKPADLPVQQSTKIELIVNTRTARALGLSIPETLLATADEVIR
jgi:putative tryptophan/tyrosine transport system substrate-binding protein